MIDQISRGATWFLRLLPPETAHSLSIVALKTGLVPTTHSKPDPRLKLTKAGLTFSNPVGLAAGYDKNAEAPVPLSRLGFGFVEVGTTTPEPQSGNPRPRIFRLETHQAVINRLGFNNLGHDVCCQNLERAKPVGLVGVNIGANKDSQDRIGDYVTGINRFYDLAAYFTINISSPNTPGLRDLQSGGELLELLGRIGVAAQAQQRQSGGKRPLFLKIAPDLNEQTVEKIAHALKSSNFDGAIVSNTTLDRRSVQAHPHAKETGGLSGKPLFDQATAVLARMRHHLGPESVLIGAGGVDSAETVLEKICAGADLVQLYTGLVYKGPGLPLKIVRGLSDHLAAKKISHISNLRDSALQRWLNTDLNCT